MSGGIARFAKKPPASDNIGRQDVKSKQNKISIPEESTAFGNNDDFRSSLYDFGEWNTGSYTDQLSNNNDFCSFLETSSVDCMNEIENANLDFTLSNETRPAAASIIKENINSDGEASGKFGVGIALFQKRSVGGNNTLQSSTESFSPSPHEDMSRDPGKILSQKRSVEGNDTRPSLAEAFSPFTHEDIAIDPGLIVFQKRSVEGNIARHSSTELFLSSPHKDMVLDPGTVLLQKRSVGGNNVRPTSKEPFSPSPREDMAIHSRTAFFQNRSVGGNNASHSSAQLQPSLRENMAIDSAQGTNFSMNIDAKMAPTPGNTRPFAHGAKVLPVNSFASNFVASSRSNEVIDNLDFKNKTYNRQIGGTHSLARFSTANVTPPSRLPISSNKVHDAPMPGIMAKHATSPLSGGTILPNSLAKEKQNSMSRISWHALGNREVVRQVVEATATPAANRLGGEGSEMPPPPPAVTPKSSCKTSPPADGFAFVHSTPRQAITWSQPAASVGDLVSTDAEQANNNTVSPESPALFDQIHRQFLNSIRDFQDKEKEYSSKLLEMNVDLSTAHALGLQTEGDMLDLTSQLEVFLQSVACTMKDSHEL